MQLSLESFPGVPRAGELIDGRYRVDALLSAGGMGVVIAGWHLALERKVAIKCMLPTMVEIPGAGARFLREARAMAVLRGQHVVAVMDMGTLPSGAPYMVMEHLAGSDVGDVIRARGRLPVDEAVDLLLQAAAGVAEAHAHSIIHRDLKPRNLFVMRRGDGAPLLKVLDFGLSKILAEQAGVPDVSLTAHGVIMGSAFYMAPEQIRSLKRADARSDVWSLGVILYEMLAGRRPFEGESVTAVYAIVLTEPAPPLTAFRADAPPGLEAVIADCLQKDPARRIPSVRELARRLAPFGSPRAAFTLELIASVGEEGAAAVASAPRSGLPAPAGWIAGAPTLGAGPPAAAPPAAIAPAPALAEPTQARWSVPSQVRAEGPGAARPGARRLVPIAAILAVALVIASLVAWRGGGSPPPAASVDAPPSAAAPAQAGAPAPEASPPAPSTGRPDAPAEAASSAPGSAAPSAPAPPASSAPRRKAAPDLGARWD